MHNFYKVIRWQSCLSLHHPVIVFMERLAFLNWLKKVPSLNVRFLTHFVVLSTTVLKWHHNITHSWAPCSIRNFSIRQTTWICIFRIILWVSHAETCLFSKEVYRNSHLSYSHTIHILEGCGNRVSCRNLFKKLQILPLASQYMLSLLIFVVQNKNLFMTNNEKITT